MTIHRDVRLTLFEAECLLAITGETERRHAEWYFGFNGHEKRAVRRGVEKIASALSEMKYQEALSGAQPLR